MRRRRQGRGGMASGRPDKQTCTVYTMIYMTSCIIDKRIISCREWSSISIISRMLWNAAIEAGYDDKSVLPIKKPNPKKLQRTDLNVWDKVKSCPCRIFCDILSAEIRCLWHRAGLYILFNLQIQSCEKNPVKEKVCSSKYLNYI